MNEIVGYEREEPFPLGGISSRRYCVACYRPDQGLPVQPLTRQALAASFLPHREAGMTNLGGMDRCFKCGKRLLESDMPLVPEEARQTIANMETIEQSVALLMDAPHWTEKEYERLQRIVGDVYRLRRALEQQLQNRRQGGQHHV